MEDRPGKKKNIRVLVVDDSEAACKAISEIIAAGGHEVVGCAKNAADAVLMFRQLKPEVITMDIIMPAVNGVDAIKRIKHLDPDAKIIAVSEVNHEDFREEARLAGANGYVHKPLLRKELLEIIEKSYPEKESR